MNAMNRRNQTALGRAFDIFNHGFFVFMMILMLFPILYVAVGSVSSTGLFNFVFGQFSVEAYISIIRSARTLRALMNSFLITLVGTAMCMIVTSLSAYGLSKKSLPGRRFFMRVVIIFMLFNPGLIPTYIWEGVKLNLIDTYWALWLPCLISSFNLIVMKNFFEQLPDSIEESARIDGCNELQSFITIVIPMSLAAIATFSLFYAVGFWNNYARPMIFLNNPSKWPITIWLKQVIIMSKGGFTDDLPEMMRVWAPEPAVKYATIVAATLPILLVYPFLQKYFAKGVLLGSIKG